MKNSNEQCVLDKVKEIYTSFPKGTINHIDSPDFVICGARNIGIEITQVLHDDKIDNKREPGFSKFTSIESNGGTVPNLKAEHLRAILDKKEVQKKSFIECDEYWLLIREGSFFADSFDDIEVTNLPDTSFDKVLLFRQSENIILELK